MALLLDYCGDQMDLATSINSMASGLATVLGNFLVFINFISFLPFLDGNYEAVYYLGIIILVVTTIPTLIVGIDTPSLPSGDDSNCFVTFFGILISMVQKALQMKLSTFLVLLFFFFISMAQYPWLLYFTDYMGKDIYHGDPDAPKGTPKRESYEEGVRMGGLAQGFFFFVIALKLILYRNIWNRNNGGLYYYSVLH